MRLIFVKILCFTLLLLSTPLLAQTIRGKVVDATTRLPVAYANIRSGPQTISADSMGVFVIAAKENNGSIRVSAIGYFSLHLSLNAPDSQLTASLLPDNGQLQDVVVSGTLKPIRRLESPIPVESYSQAFLKQNPTPSIMEALSLANGIQPQINCNVCNTGDIRLNGMDGPYTMVLIDGMPIVSSLSTVYGLSGIPTSIIKRIEVVKGPASTLYGSEAVGGIINIITKDPLSSSRLSADISATTLGEVNADFGAKMKVGNATGLLGFNGFFFNTRHDINQDNFTDITLQKRNSLFTKWDWQRTQQLPATMAIRLFTERRWGGEMQWERKFLGGDSLYAESIDTKRAELIGQYGLSKNMLLEYSYNYHFQDSYYGTTIFRAQQHTAFAQLRWDKHAGKHELLAGIPFRYLWYDDNTPATGKPGENNPSLQTMTALYAQDEIRWKPSITTLFGIRYEYTNLQGGVVAPRLAIKWQPVGHHTLRLSGGNGYRIVNLFNEDHAALSGFREIVIKNDLEPEKSWNVNFNYSGDIHLSGGVFSWDASLFYTRFSNKIIPDYKTDPNKIIYDNLDGYAISKGISGNLNLTLQNGWRAMTGFTFLNVYSTENGTRSTQLYAPKWSGTTTA